MGGAAPPRCGGEDDPVELRIVERSPALGATVKNQLIEESLTIADSPILIELSVPGLLVQALAHTAGYSESDSTDFSRTISGSDQQFGRDVGPWSEAPGYVELEVTTGWKSEAGCHYRLPRPVLSYDVIR